MTKVLTVVYTAPAEDIRVMNEATSAASAGFDVTVIGAALIKAHSPHQSIGDVEVITLPPVSSFHPPYLLKALWYVIRGNLEGFLQLPVVSRKANVLALIFFNLWVLRLGMRFNFHLIHSHDHQPLLAAWLLARLRHVPVIYDAHEFTSVNKQGYGLKGTLGIWVERMLIGHVDAVITVGERLAAALREMGARRVIIIGNWKRLEAYEIAPSTLAEMRRELGLDNAQLVVTYIGELEERRTIRPLLQAVANLPDIHLLIGGRGALEATVEEAAQHAPNIHWLGWVNIYDVPRYTQLGDVIYSCFSDQVQQAYYGVPNKLFDSFAAGKAIIAQPGSEMAEILKTVGSGILLDEVSSERLQETFTRLRDPSTLQALQAQARVARETYNWRVAEERLRTLYAELIGGQDSA